MRQWPIVISTCFLLSTSGCTEQDLEKLRLVGSKAMDKATDLTEHAGQKVGINLNATKSKSEDLDLGARVQTRLRWDQQLQGANIKVETDDGNVTLKGTVKDEAQRKRAVELAQSTEGVKRIADVMGVKAEK